MGNITAIGNAAGANPATETYSYDPLYRLTAITEAGGSTLQSVIYNPTGDRLSKTGNGQATGAYSYNTNTHQLVATGSYARAVDANGNTTAITAASGNLGFGYNLRNRMTVAQLAGSTVGSYTYDALGERIGKVAGTANERYGYDEDQQLLSEQGATNRDYVWMDGIPVANVDTTGTTSTLAYVTADQLGTPRAIADASGNTEWTLPYAGNAWGETTPTSGGYTYNLRFPGQYADAETGLSNNVNRDYDSATGRYIESDPIGLDGGINTYAYVGGDPLDLIDPLGFVSSGPMCRAAWATAGAACGAAVGGVLGGVGGAVGAGGACTLVAPGVGTVGCGVAGGAEGASAGTAAGAGLGGAIGAWAGSKACDGQDPCPPCQTVSGKIVRIGTISYRPLDTPTRPQHGIDGPHYNIYKANQAPRNSPRPCKCFWQPIGAVPPSGLPSDAIPMEPFAN
ncbi:RHS repeat-associated core domain-containing protein [Dyella agri]|uniref:RHS repeat-associated core domain-containing protein n=1 Tax=Dyella agri TaxID=1926869 RepID=A0ABW8KIE7_9GAMM